MTRQSRGRRIVLSRSEAPPRSFVVSACRSSGVITATDAGGFDLSGPNWKIPNPNLAPPGWKPSLGSYLYVGLTNSIAFSPTDTMPLTRWAKLSMGAESVIAIVSLLVVAARAVNILGGG